MTSFSVNNSFANAKLFQKYKKAVTRIKPSPLKRDLVRIKIAQDLLPLSSCSKRCFRRFPRKRKVYYSGALLEICGKWEEARTTSTDWFLIRALERYSPWGVCRCVRFISVKQTIYILFSIPYSDTFRMQKNTCHGVSSRQWI